MSRDQQSSKNLPVSHCVDFKGSIKRTKYFTLALGRDFKLKVCTETLSSFATKWNWAVGVDMLLKFH